MIIFRLSKAKYADNLDGRGAELAGGRWNSKGTRLVYASESRALCMVEIAVRTPLGNLPVDYRLVHIEIPEDAIEYLKPADIPTDWKSFPHPHSTQQIGDRFVKEGSHLVLRVPSASVQEEYNYLINPAHPDIKGVKVVKVEEFTFDQRLFKK